MGTVLAGTNATATQFNDVVYLNNYIMNGNFNIWQRGTTSTNPADAAFIADRWHVSRDADGGTLPTNTIHSQQTLTAGDIPNSFYYYRINPDGAGSGFGTNAQYVIRQKIEHGTRLLAGASRKATLTFYARASVVSKKLGVGMFQNYGTTGSPSSAETLTGTSITLSTSWVKYSHTFTLNTLVGKTFGTDNNDYLMPVFGVMWGTTYGSNTFGGAAASTFDGSGTIDIAQVQLTIGDTSMEYKPLPYEWELRQCQRYCYVIDTDALAAGLNGVVGFGTAGTGTTAYILLNLPVSIRAYPTLTVTADQWALWDGFSGAHDVTSLTLVGANYTAPNTILLNASIAGGLTQYRTYYLTADGTARLLILEAEL